MCERFFRWKMRAVLGATLLLAGCSSVDLWPFGGDGARERSRKPTNAVEYQCEGGKGFHLRRLDGGASVWVILPEREFRLDKVAAATGMRFSNGAAMLDLSGSEVTLTDAPAVALTGCKSAGG